MMYLLTQQEFDALKERQELIRIADIGKLQELCTKIACEMPAYRDWRPEDKSPWGCILVKTKDPYYCDRCPVRELCPFTSKRWSK